MPLPPFIKSPACLSGLGAAGSGVISIGGWQFVEGVYPTADRQLTSKNLLLNPVPPALDADTSTGIHSTNENKYHLKTYGCFNRFFPGAEVKHSASGNEGTFNDTLKSETQKAKKSGTPLGCALMNLSYEGVSDANKNTKYIFKSEVTVKNDKFGWALWVGAKDMKASSEKENDISQAGLDYYLLFLEKELNKENSWSIIGGYSWIDVGGASVSHNPATLHISTPNKEDWASLIRSHRDKTTKEHREYSGIWEASGVGNEVFQDIEFWYSYNKSENAEILGRVDMDFSKEPTISATRGYEKSTGWRWLKGSDVDVGSTLNAFYAPFAGKRGIWKRSDEYCKSKSYSRGLNDSQLEELKRLCYSANASQHS